MDAPGNVGAALIGAALQNDEATVLRLMYAPGCTARDRYQAATAALKASHTRLATRLFKA